MKYTIIFTTIVILFFAACNSHKQKLDAAVQDVQLNNLTVELEGAVVADTAMSAPPSQEPDDKKEVKQKQPAANASESKPDWNKKIIKTASLNIEVKGYKKFNEKAVLAAVQFGGYIANEQQNETEYKIENIITIKIPVDQFQNAIDFLITGDGKINEKKITSDDVTTQFVDTKLRLEAKKQVRLRYLDLLKQAKNMEEILQVQSEIDDIQEEIESAAGRINYLSNASAMSTIHLTFYQVLNGAAKDTDTPGFLKKVKDAFVTGWKGVGEVLVGLVYLWPLIVLLVGVVWVVKRYKINKGKIAAVKSEV